ncbi:MAG: ATP-binding protein [Clostridia bacterium]|nr:ATP-binding protein [Clostridia bacterium]
MKNSEVKKFVLEQIKNVKIQNENIAEENLKKALFNEEFKNAYSLYKSLNIKKTKLNVLGEDTKQIDGELNAAKDKLQSVIKKLKLSTKDFKPNYSCKICSDSGEVGGEYCTCYYKKLNEQLLKNLGANVDSAHNFENADFSIFDNSEQIKKLYKKVEEWCDNLSQSKCKTLVLSGDPGVGKTYLTECICNKLINKNLVVNYYSSFALNDLFYKYHTAFYQNKAGLLDGVLESDILIIDDFGSEPKTKATEEYFYAILNERLVKNKHTIISTNLLPMQILDKYGERTFSRLNNKASSVMIKIENKDLRLKRK